MQAFAGQDEVTATLQEIGKLKENLPSMNPNSHVNYDLKIVIGGDE